MSVTTSLPPTVVRRVSDLTQFDALQVLPANVTALQKWGCEMHYNAGTLVGYSLTVGSPPLSVLQFPWVLRQEGVKPVPPLLSLTAASFASDYVVLPPIPVLTLSLSLPSCVGGVWAWRRCVWQVAWSAALADPLPGITIVPPGTQP